MAIPKHSSCQGDAALYTAQTLDASTAPGRVRAQAASSLSPTDKRSLPFRRYALGICPETDAEAGPLALLRDKLQKSKKLIHRIGMLQIHGLPVAADDAVANHFGGPALLGHLVGIECFGRTDTTICAMRSLKAGMETGVAVAAIAVTIARQLIHHRGQFGDGSVRSRLHRLGKALHGELLFREDRREHLTFGRRLGMERGKWIFFNCPVGLSDGGSAQ